ncbi:MAG: ATP synthase F1 subunit gamma [Planctomycetota bacterium]|jgi:F-type H+-transporting ATPase subunit gamma|nr:ATP synthase F1 subunit gamma [Planctomycetota bacterium]MED5446894.1 ATP synthase F1 subunit gamma [Planctomycetota bacterium]MEE3366793.1 ATP synthase F1 subunit gamma [Planctomycetota bacterium]
MANIRAIVKRLKAVRNVRKITRTMELIATARFKKAMDRATEAAAYTQKIAEIVSDLSGAALSFSHPLLEGRDTQQKSAVLVLTSNRGLCGGYNGGVLRLAVPRMKELREAGQDVSLEVSGKRGLAFLRFQGETVGHEYTHFEDKPTFDEVDELASRYIDAYIAGDLDRLDVAYTRFESSSRQSATIETLLPVGSLDDKDSAVSESDSDEPTDGGASVDYEFLPSAGEILEEIVPASFKARLFKCFLDAAVSEQIFRMVAMKGATENAGEMIDTLSMQYNRARQTQITSELSEIIGGAAALE